MASYSSIRVDYDGGLATVTLARPELHNAFNPAMIGEVTACFEALAGDPDLRGVVLTGAGRSFCAGADLTWMRQSAQYNYEENLADAERLALMFDAVNRLPKPLIGRVNGAAIGGGAGLVACCDLVIAVDQAAFGFSEVKLGLLPAVISPLVVAKIGMSHARALFLTGARFGVERAAAIGLVHQVVAAPDLDGAVAEAVAELVTSAPGALAATKALLASLERLPPEERRSHVVTAIARARTGPEGQSGLSSFLGGTPPPWSSG